MTTDYNSFLRSKIVRAPVSGFEIGAEELNPALKPHQRDAVLWALRGGRRALFESFGLGKTVQELEWCHQVVRHEGGQALIILPLGVRQEFRRDAERLLGYPAPSYVTTMAEAEAAGGEILMTNYERVRDGDIDPKRFGCCVLDEASVLRSFGSKTSQVFLAKFHGVKYKLVATATPAPNRLKELVHYAGFLETADPMHIFQKFFQRDSKHAHEPTLYPHLEAEFWNWVSDWALFLSSPGDLGYDDTGYALPPLDVRRHVIRDDYGTACDRDGQMKLMHDAAVSLTEAAREKNESIAARVAKAKEIVDSDPEAHFLLWHDLEAERYAIEKALPETVEIHGAMDYDERERRVIDFSEGRCRLFATKKSLSGSGCNFQRYCHRAIFVGIDYEFNDFIQAIHRIYRFLQTEQVIIDIIYTEAEDPVYRALMRKWKQYDEMQETMRKLIREYGLFGRGQLQALVRSIGVERAEVRGQTFTAIHNDCVAETEGMAENSVDLILTSIPFSNQFEYTPSYNDFGHNESTERFFEQMDYLTPNLLRVLKPGRVYACHVKDRVLYGNVTGLGMPTVEPFHALCIRHYMKHGFQYMGMITVMTDVVRENNQTYRLVWSEQCKDATKMGVGMLEYVLLFRKLPSDTANAYADEPVTKTKDEYSVARWQLDAHAFERSSGDRLLTPEEMLELPMDRLQAAYRKYSRETVYDYRGHVAFAEELRKRQKLSTNHMTVPPASNNADVWDDVTRIRTLNTEQKRKNLQMHVCPLQFDIVDRMIERYSNPGELVFDPFGGIGTVPLRAIKLGRRGMMTELNPDYFRDAVRYLKDHEEQIEQPSLFDVI